MTNKRFIAECSTEDCSTEVHNDKIPTSSRQGGGTGGTKDVERHFDGYVGPDIAMGGVGDTNVKPITGTQLLWNQILAIWMKLFLVWTRSWTMVVLQILAPILLINSTLAMIFYVTRKSEIIERRAFTLTKGLDFQLKLFISWRTVAK